jgi:hypothetical protein
MPAGSARAAAWPSCTAPSPVRKRPIPRTGRTGRRPDGGSTSDVLSRVGRVHARAGHPEAGRGDRKRLFLRRRRFPGGCLAAGEPGADGGGAISA